MRWLGRTDLRVILAILLTALIPLLASAAFARAIVARISATAFQPEFGQHLDQALSVYADLARAMKDGLRQETLALASSRALRQPTFLAAPSDSAATAPTAPADPAVIAAARRDALAVIAAAHPRLSALAIEPCDGAAPLASWLRPTSIDLATERPFHVSVTLHPDADPSLIEADSVEPTCSPGGLPRRLVATFAVPRARFDELEDATAFAQAYHEVERNHREEYLDATYRNALVVMLAVTIAIGIALALLVTRPVTAGIAALTRATQAVATGDLAVRVPVRGASEVAQLGRAFNRMLEEVEQSRARVEFLRRVGEWQKVARRLAHEIKNPLTPIQLAVEECHRRYPGDDGPYTKILDTTLEVVREEVGSLRRLVTEFSGFARLPRASLTPGDLARALADESAYYAALASDRGSLSDGEASLFGLVDITIKAPPRPMPAVFDREMLHRVLGNVIKNAAQALRDARGSRADDALPSWGSVHVSAHSADDAHVIDIDDNGPGVPAAVRTTLFDPYVTTKRDGTGLGLTIVKKIIVDHGGSIEVCDAPRGGARVRIRLPPEGTAASLAALERSLRDDDDPLT